ncbi:RabGAP/TBC [Trametes versicolor FP-101664 SS1]|uniref:RabGAP/TBC n=1 Tax=Trametes versicolor (strain FP-101664) TaxID=717944 RepID=R7S8B0_TRAVS|nr:RabGAP/TBC [Trametes versicolor FP-101664 SS1]EIW51902.1 RabGAP/TBC [Trametes versicolor FP-101664 SS1]
MSPPSRVMSPPGRVTTVPPPGMQNTMSPPLQQGGPPAAGTSQPIQRANFTPAAGMARPRSRSFSGFESGNQEDRMQALARGSREEGAVRLASVKPLQITTKRSKSAMATTTTAAAQVAAPQRATVSHASSVVRGVHAPSPLSLSSNNTAAMDEPVRSPPPRALTNPLPTSHPPPAADALARVGAAGPGAPVMRALLLDQAAGFSGPGAAGGPVNVNGYAREQPMQSPLEALQESFARGANPPASPRSAGVFPKASPVLRHSRSAVLSTTSSRSEMSSPLSGTTSLSRPSIDTLHTDATSPVITSPAESISESSSVLGLKINKKNRPKDSSNHDPRSPTLSTYTSASEHTVDQETVQVQDMGFELVKPNMLMSPFAGSVDSLPIPSPIRSDGFLRTDSPAMSTTSGSSSLRIPMDLSPNESNKKIRKLVLEGVPTSVRYQVWAALADSKGKRMDGLYQRLAQREKVPAFADIERDIRESFVDRPELQDGSLAKMLQAYLCMVPNVQYSKGLALIAGQLLLQSPEEDAFWTFISLMDSHLRPYFSTSVQLEVDASLFARALEANDPASAKKVFGDMAIPPAAVCRPWFMAVFAATLQPDYLLRVWDVFLFEGVTFLFRVGLAIFAGCRRLVLQSTSPDDILNTLCHPPPTALPLNPEAFIELALSVKLKDDDVRKQRNKLEAQVKRRTQPRASPLTSTPTISLPSAPAPASRPDY